MTWNGIVDFKLFYQIIKKKTVESNKKKLAIFYD